MNALPIGDPREFQELVIPSEAENMFRIFSIIVRDLGFAGDDDNTVESSRCNRALDFFSKAAKRTARVENGAFEYHSFTASGRMNGIRY